MSNDHKAIILHVINSLGRGGAEVLLCNTIALLPQYEHVIVTLSGPHDQLEQLIPYIKAHHCLHASSVLKWGSGIVQLRKLIQQYQPILVHVHLQVAGVITKLACPRQIPLFYSLHNPYSIDAFAVNRYAKFIEKLTARSWHHLIGVSRLALEDYQHLIPNSGTGDVVYNMVGMEFFKSPEPEPYVPGQPLRLVSVGNLKKQKNYQYTLRAMQQLQDLPISLDIYGDGYERTEIEAFISKHQLKNIQLKGKVPDIAKRLRNYDAYIISSVYEGFGIAPLEAMAIGLPTLVSDIPVFREVAGNAVPYFNINDPDALARMLREIYSGTLSIESYGKAGREQANRIALPDVYITQLLSVYGKYLPEHLKAS